MTNKAISRFGSHGYRELKDAGELLIVYCDQKPSGCSNDISIIFNAEKPIVYLKDFKTNRYFRVEYKQSPDSRHVTIATGLIECDKDGYDLP